MLGRSRLLGFRSFCKSSSSYDLSNKYKNLMSKERAPLLVNYGNGYIHMLDGYDKDDCCAFTNKYPAVSVQFPYNFLVTGPCNGLFCLYSSDGPIALWNPGTGDINNLSSEEQVPADEEIQIQNLGFGFDSNSNDYKIVRCITRRFVNPYYKNVDEMIHQFEVYSLKSKQWREIPVVGEMRSYLPCILSPALFVDGACCWNVPLEDCRLADRLISFDFVEEEFHIIPLYYSYNTSENFLNFDGYLAAVFAPGSTKKVIHVWLRMPLNGVKTWIYQMVVGPFSGKYCHPHCDVDAHDDPHDLKPLCLWKNQGLVLFDETQNKIIYYDFHTKEYRPTIVFPEPKIIEKPPVQVLNFPESFVPNPW